MAVTQGELVPGRPSRRCLSFCLLRRVGRPRRSRPNGRLYRGVSRRDCIPTGRRSISHGRSVSERQTQRSRLVAGVSIGLIDYFAGFRNNLRIRPPFVPSTLAKREGK